MRRFLFVVGLALLIGGLFLAPKGTRRAKAIEISQSYNFGNILEQQSVAHDFLLINNTDYPLKIIEIAKSCGCTQASLDHDTIARGKEAILSAQLTPEITGAIHTVIRVKWQTIGGDTQLRSTDFLLYANVLSVLDYPAQLHVVTLSNRQITGLDGHALQ
jgi:hypothetical protein